MIQLSEEPVTSAFTDLADWIEVRAGDLGLSTVTESAISRSLGQLGVPVAQDAVAGAIGVMRRRSAALKDCYPFETGTRRLTYRPSPRSDFYLALAELSVVSHESLEASELSALASTFEEVVADVLASTWGSAGHALHFGWPTRAGRPRPFPLAVSWLAKRLKLKEGRGYRPPERQDGGVDLVAWNRLADGTTADVRLGQCTISRDLERKTRDVDVGLWETWLDFPQRPTVVLLVPYQIPKRSSMASGLGARGFLVLDRVRLTAQWGASGLEVGSSAGRLRELIS